MKDSADGQNLRWVKMGEDVFAKKIPKDVFAKFKESLGKDIFL